MLSKPEKGTSVSLCCEVNVRLATIFYTQPLESPPRPPIGKTDNFVHPVRQQSARDNTLVNTRTGYTTGEHSEEEAPLTDYNATDGSQTIPLG